MGQCELKFRTWGGTRKGAGRRRDPKKHEPMHVARPKHTRWKPLHVVMRCAIGVPRLRTGEGRFAIRAAIAQVYGRAGFRVCHVSIQANHLHLICEADDSATRTTGIQTLAMCLARSINRAFARTGKVFAHRYHLTSIATPTQLRNTLQYVFSNWRKHGEDQRSLAARATLLDPYSSAHMYWNHPACCAEFKLSRPTAYLFVLVTRDLPPISPYPPLSLSPTENLRASSSRAVGGVGGRATPILVDVRGRPRPCGRAPRIIPASRASIRAVTGDSPTP